MDKIIKVTYKNVVLSLIKDCYIYEVFYNNVYLGYFHFSRLVEAIEVITNNGFYDGFNYDYRLKNLNLI